MNDLSCVCYPGEIIGLLGHNGAGKSTTLKCLTGILPFTSGKIVINGYDITKEPVKAKYTFGFVSDKHDVFVKLTGMQYIDFMASAYGVDAKTKRNALPSLTRYSISGTEFSIPSATTRTACAKNMHDGQSYPQSETVDTRRAYDRA